MAREKPFSFNAAAEVQRRTQLNNAGLDRFAPSGRGLTTPATFLAGGPTISAGQTYRFIREHQHVTCWWNFFGLGGSTTQWFMQLPYDFTSSASGWLDTDVGSWTAVRTSTADVISGWVEMATGVSGQNNLVRFCYRNTAGIGPKSVVSSTLPWVWQSELTARFTGFLTYESADAYGPN